MEKQPSLAGRIHKATLDLHCLFSCAAMRNVSPGTQNTQKGAVVLWVAVLRVSLSLDQECPQVSPGGDTWSWIYLEKHWHLEFQCLEASSCHSTSLPMVFSPAGLPKHPGYLKPFGMGAGFAEEQSCASCLGDLPSWPGRTDVWSWL